MEKNRVEKDKFMTLKDAASAAQISYATIKRDIEAGVLPAHKVGRKYFIAASVAQEYAEKRCSLQQMVGYTIKEMMEILPLSYAFIIELIKKGELHAVKVGRQYIVSEEEFTRFLQASKLS